jgi:spore maturation protein SpmB
MVIKDFNLENLFFKRFRKCVMLALPLSWKTTKWLIKITIPVSFGVFLLDFTGILSAISLYTAPVFEFAGLPGEAALVFITSIFTNIYSVIAIISMLGLPVREGIILATMCLISHGFIIESVVLRKTGSNLWRMLSLRLIMSFVSALLLNLILPQFEGVVKGGLEKESLDFVQAFVAWLWLMARMSLKILILITLLMIMQKVFEEFGIMKTITNFLKPLMNVLGLSPEVAFGWFVGNAVGLAYGSAVLIEQVNEGKVTSKQADLLNHHLAVSHSQLEDPLLFYAIGLPMLWLMGPRVILAIIAVWQRKLEYQFRTAPLTGLKIPITKM